VIFSTYSFRSFGSDVETCFAWVVIVAATKHEAMTIDTYGNILDFNHII